MDEFFASTMLSILGAGIRFLCSKIFGSGNGFRHYLNDEYSALNAFVGTIAFLSIVLIVLLLIFEK